MVATGEFTYKDAIVAGCFEKILIRNILNNDKS